MKVNYDKAEIVCCPDLLVDIAYTTDKFRDTAQEDESVMMTVLLTQEEVAERLRRSVETVKRLRLSGKLAYYPGRPAMIAEADLEDYLAKTRRAAAESEDAKARELEPRTDMASARAWAIQQVFNASGRSRKKKV